MFVFSKLKEYISYILIGVGSVAVTFLVSVAYDTLVDDPRVKREAQAALVSKAEYDAVKAKLALREKEQKILNETLVIYRNLSTKLVRDKQTLSQIAEDKINKDTSEDGCKVTQEDLDWLNK